MRLYLFFLLFLNISLTSVIAQNITLRVLGKTVYTQYAESNGIVISFDNNNFENEKNRLTNLIKEIGIKNNLISIDKPSSSTINNKKFKIEESNLVLFDELLISCNKHNFKIEKVYYKMPIHKFENEDENAILAFNNASTQAKIIADNLNYKITNILNIDDDTTESSSIYDILDKDTERGRMVIRLLILLGGGENLFQPESSNPERLGGYNLWVTFEMKPK